MLLSECAPEFVQNLPHFYCQIETWRENYAYRTETDRPLCNNVHITLQEMGRRSAEKNRLLPLSAKAERIPENSLESTYIPLPKLLL